MRDVREVREEEMKGKRGEGRDEGVVLLRLICSSTNLFNVAFILPPLAFIKLEKGKWYSRRKLPYALIFGFGVFSVIITVANTIQAAISDD